ncbi:sushi, von Willebrand factor type A, EGF and pentraxin domain-containing protein 1-like [Lytechinus pictus]|uniref:sushi, von Willebrand factor type A, EGF and pentraxin domain-containing protein 1-like n=1 Tax=Lytechinus pictus TaxID=7653 RepID=UPI0030BA1062
MRYYYEENEAQFVGLAGDYANRTLFWSSTLNRTIYKGGLDDDSEASALFVGTSTSVEGLAVDWMAKNLYWADSAYDWIMVSDYNATYFTILIDTGLEKPRGIATFPQRGYLFWSDWGEEKRIERSTLAGEGRITLVNSSIHYPNGITIDTESERVFWVDAMPEGSRIEWCNIDGSNRTLLVQMQRQVTHLFDLVINGNDIFMTSLTRHMLRVNKNTGGVSETLSLGARPFGITLYGPLYQPDVISPCASNPCQHLCTSSPDSSFTCVCSHGYELTKNGTSCVRDGEKIGKPQLLFVTRNEITRFPSNFADISESQTVKNKYLVANRTLLVAIEMDARAEMMFYSDYGKREIYRVRLYSGRSIKTIVGGVGSAEGLAVDWLNQNLYWTDAVRRHIAVSRYDGSRRKYLIVDDVIRPRSIVIHANLKLMFWTEFGPPSQLERANLDGTGHMLIKTGLNSPNGLAIDFINDRLFYATRGDGVINSVDFDGLESQRIYQKSGAKYFDIELFRGYLYFTEWGTDSGLHAVSLTKQELVKSMHVSKVAYGVRMYDDTRQPDGISACDEESCDQLCLPRSTEGFVCHCSIGFTLADDNVTCTVDIMEDSFVLIADTHIPGIFQISMDAPMTRFAAIPLEDMVRTIALAYDPIDSMVYWTDVRLGSFSRAHLNGTGQETLGRSGVDGPDGLTIDPISRLLYWTDVARNTITVSSLDGTTIKTLIDTDLDQPRAIVLDPVGGYMYYSDWGSVPKIEKAHMDGTNRQIIVDSEIAWPNGIALDVDAGKLYWGDAKIDRIERVNLDGTGREMIVNLAPRGHPYGVAIYGDHVYWSDWKKYGLMRANKNNGSGMEEAGPQTFTRVSEIHIYNSTRESGSNDCSVENGGCSHLCIPTPTGRVCKCSDGIELDTETNTTCLTSNLTCSANVSFGSFLMEDCTFEPGRRCTVECIPGYWSETEKYDVLCLPNGEWDMDMSTFCTVVECPVVNVTANASVVACADPPIQNSTCVHECQLGYKWSSGNAHLTCEKDGTWSGATLYCTAITCPPFDNLDNGMYRPTNCSTVGGLFDDECLLFCQHGYQHFGAYRRTCGLDGRWSDEEIESTCIDITPPNFGDTCPESRNMTAERGMSYILLNISDPVATDNSEGNVTYRRSATSPFQLDEGENILSVYASDEANNTAKCETIVNLTVKYCDYLSVPLNGGIFGNCSYHYGSVCHYSCNPGYRLIGSDTRTCEMGGPDGTQPTWVGERAICERVECPHPVVPNKVVKSGCEAPYTLDAECTFMCDPGYFKVNGTALRTCQEDGTWSGEDFYCESRRCDPIAPFEHGVIEPPSCVTIGGTVHNVCTLSCSDGYRYQGQAEHTCQEIGGWSNYDDSHICEDALAPHFNGTCPPDQTVIAPAGSTQAVATWDLPEPVDPNGAIYNFTATRKSGVTLSEGTHAIVITATDMSGNTATCRFYVTVQVIRCPQELLPSNSHWIGNCSQLVGSSCTLGCQTGYNVSGAVTKKCVWDQRSSTGNWEWQGNQPVCQAVTCPAFPVDQRRMKVFGCGVSPTNQSPQRYGTQCKIFCMATMQMFLIRGTPFVNSLCGEDGNWSPTVECRPTYCPPLELAPNVVVRSRPPTGDICTDGPVPSGTMCFLGCRDGYVLNTVIGITRCMSDGRWLRKDSRTPLKCIDSTPPKFTNPCPLNVTVMVPRCSISANVTYSIPQATDNASNVSISGPNETFPVLLSRGRHQRIYSARDKAGNVAMCQVDIKVVAPVCRDEPEWRSGSLRVESMSCRNLLGSTVRFTCANPGMRLVGMRERVCQQNAQWNGTSPTCEMMTCPALDLPPNSIAIPSSCSTSNLVNGGTFCKVTCGRGFSGSYVRTRCANNGTWTQDITGVQCRDTAHPVYSYCPPGMTVSLQPGANTAAVRWRLPVPTDNVGVVNTTSPGVFPPVQLAPGTELFTYTATDAQGLTGTCSFDVTVVDAEPPVALNCPGEDEVIIVQANAIPVRVDYTAPLFTDNVGIAHERKVQWYSRYRWQDNFAFEWGYTELNFMAMDTASNTANCNLKFEVIQSTECPELVAPPNSQLTCDESGSVCRLACNAGFIQASEDIQMVFSCQSSGLWNSSTEWDKNPFLPVCTRRQVASSVTWDMTADVVFTLDGRCPTERNDLQTSFETLFQTSSLFKACSRENSVSCALSDISVSCRSDSSVPAGGPRRRRRESPPRTVAPPPDTATFALRMTTTSDVSSVPSFFSNYDTSINNMWSQDDVSLSLPNSVTATLDPARSGLGDFMPICGRGQVEVNKLCEYCPPGTFKNLRAPVCERCRKGSYQSLMGQTTCIRCADGKSTRATGAYSADHCEDMCLAGTYSYLGLVPDCLQCPRGSFQENRGQRGCEPCSGNTTTSGPGASSSRSCIDPADVTSPRPTTEGDDISGEVTPTDSNAQSETTQPGTLSIKSSPAIMVTDGKGTVTMTTQTRGHPHTPGRKTGEVKGGLGHGVVIGICVVLFLLIVIILVIVVVLWKRRSDNIPMIKLTNISSSPDEYTDDEDDGIVGDGKYHQMQEMDHFDLEHLATYGDEDTPQAKRNSFSNALFKSEDQDHPGDDAPKENVQVWTTFDESQT